MTKSYSSLLPKLDYESKPEYDQIRLLSETVVGLVKSIPLAEYRNAVLEVLEASERSIDTFALAMRSIEILLGHPRPWTITYMVARNSGVSYASSTAIAGADKAFVARVKKAAEELAAEGLIIRGKNSSRTIIWATQETCEREAQRARAQANENELARQMGAKLIEIFPEVEHCTIYSGQTTVPVPANVLAELLQCWNEVHGS